MIKNKKTKALLLLSGGLDSMLTAYILKRENIDVVAIQFRTGLEYVSIKADLLEQTAPSSSLKISKDLDIELRIVSLEKTYLDMFLNPKYGYGSAVNPCIDCHILMLKHAKKIMDDEGFDFVATGEVKGQRPMSQKANDLVNVEKESGLTGYLLRPLSAKTLAITIPEKEGLINRDNLYDITGRARNMQMSLAKEFGIEEYEAPAGAGCSIVDKGYARRYYDFIEHQGTDILNMKLMKYLAIGRHIRLDKNYKLLIGRNEDENNALEKRNCAKGILLIPNYIKGPAGFIEIYEDNISDDIIKKAVGIIAYYSKEDLIEFSVKSTGVNIDYKEKDIISEKNGDFQLIN